MTDSELAGKLADNLRVVRSRIESACVRAGQPASDVTLVAVTKYVSPRIAGLLHEAGAMDLGESRPQELWRKADALPSTVRWHMIGHLQRNKIDRTLSLVAMIHSVDSLRLVEALGSAAARLPSAVDVLLEVNLSGEASKTGMPPALLAEAKSLAGQYPGLAVRGLMTMAAESNNPESARPTFAALRQLGGPVLSMGMSHDFEVAIEEGATHVRVGSLLFEGIAPEVLRAD